MLRWLKDYRARQRAILAAARERDLPRGGAQSSTPTRIVVPPHGETALAQVDSTTSRHPFAWGLFAGLGALAAYGAWQALGEVSTALTLIVVSFFLALALNPLVDWLQRRGLGRGWSVLVVFLGVLAFFSLLAAVVVPTVVHQGNELVTKAPDAFDQFLHNERVVALDEHYHFIDKAREEFDRRLKDGNLWTVVFGGVLGAGRAIVSGVFSTVTVLVLTLYFLTALPAVKQAGYALLPLSRRGRIASLSEEIMRRVGSYAIGQVCVATINALCSYVMMKIVGLPFAAVLSVIVGFLGLIPMVGATAGAIIVASVALVDDPRKALIVVIYYIVYQQLENYALMPKIMQRTVSVPSGVTIVAALIGGSLLGVLGALLAIPTAAGLLLLYDEVLVPRQNRR